MALNEHLRNANHLSLPVPSGTKSGSPVRVGALNGVTQTGRGEGGNAKENATVWLDGSWHLKVADPISNIGDPVYLDGDALKVTKGSGHLFGAALATQTSAGVIPVKIIQAGA